MARDSEIFDNYIKIALEKGIVSNNAPLRKGAEKKSKVDSSDISAIEVLYGVKPKVDKSLDYKNNIMEVAHPNSVVLAPSYDKLNGLVENNIERQRVMLNIVTKMPNGHLTNKKYAESELVHSLVRVANDMDNKDIDALRILADTCTEQIQKRSSFFDTITNFFTDKSKDVMDVGGGALGGAEIGGIIGGLLGAFGGPVTLVGGAWTGAQIGAVVGGLIASISKTSPQAKNVAMNADFARTQLTDLIQTLPNDKSLLTLDSALVSLSATAKQYALIVSQMRTSTNSVADKTATESIAKQYLTELAKSKKLIGLFMSSSKAGQYVREENPYWSKIKGPFTAIFGDDVKDEEGALSSLETIIDEAIKDVQKVQVEAASIKAQVEIAPKTQPIKAPATISTPSPDEFSKAFQEK